MRISTYANSIGMSSLYLQQATNNLSKSSERLASGKRILSAADDVGNLGKLQTMKSHRISLNAEKENIQSAKDFANVMDGALSQITELAQKINEQYASDSFDQDVVDEYTAQINDILTNTQYNGQAVFSGESNMKAGIDFKSSLVTGSGGSVASALDFSSADKATESFDAIVKEYGKLGAKEAGLESRLSVNETMQTNLSEAISRIEDVDITEETTNYNKYYAQQTIAAQMISKMQENQLSLVNILI